MVLRILFILGNLTMNLDLGVHKHFHDYDLIFLLKKYPKNDQVMIKVGF